MSFNQILYTLFSISEQAARLRAELHDLSDSLNDDEREYLSAALLRIETSRVMLLRMIHFGRTEH